MNSKTTGTMAAAMLLGIAAMAGAGNVLDVDVRVQSVWVSFADLDLRKPEGVAALHWRLRQATIQACVQGEDGMRAREFTRKCREKAIEAAVPGLPAAVRAYHAQWRANGGRWFDRTGLPTAASPPR